MKKGFDCEKYLKMQSEKILERAKMFDHKLYLEFGGKLFDDHHAERVLPGFEFDIKIKLLQQMKEDIELIFCINAGDIQRNKIRADYGITYDMEVLRIMDKIRKLRITANSVVITQYKGQQAADMFRKKLELHNVKVYVHTLTKGYPTDVETIVSEEGYGANPYIKTTKKIVIVTAPGPSSGKLATCLSQMYHEHKSGVKAGYAKFETFPVWNLPISHPINVAYEAATADLKDVNMIDSFHLEKYGVTAINYNRDLAVFPVLKNILKQITNQDLYHSPTDMGVNVIGECIVDDEVVRKAARKEIIRRYYKSLTDYKQGVLTEDVPNRIKMLIDEHEISLDERRVINAALEKKEKIKTNSMALELTDGTIITGRTTDLMTAPASTIINTLKYLSKIEDIHLISPFVLEPMLKLKKEILKGELLTAGEVLLALSITGSTNPMVSNILTKLKNISNSDAHITNMILEADEKILRRLKINFTTEPNYFSEDLYINE